MLDLLKKDDLISMKHLNELIQNLNKKEEIEEKKLNTWLIVGLVALGVAIAGVIVYKMFFASDEDFEDFDDFDEDFEDMDYDEDFDEDFDDFEDFDEEEDIEEDFEEDEE